MIFSMILNSGIYEKLPLKMWITTKVTKMAYTHHLHIFNKKHGTSLYLSIWESADKCEGGIQVYVMHIEGLEKAIRGGVNGSQSKFLLGTWPISQK
jgi:hypothetical protein